MGMYDIYIPNPSISCYRCGDIIPIWQSKDGPCEMITYYEGDKLDDCHPIVFDIYKICERCNILVTATCYAEYGRWARTEVEKNEQTHNLSSMLA
jgi:hypothetical protein